MNNFQTPICPLEICLPSISCFSMSKLMNITDNKQISSEISANGPEENLRDRDTKTRSIAEFLVSGIENSYLYIQYIEFTDLFCFVKHEVINK